MAYLQLIFEDFSGRSSIKAYEDEPLSSIFGKYFNSSRNYSENLSFVFNGKKFTSNMTAFQAGLSDGCIVKVEGLGNMKGSGGIGMNFTDLSKKKFQEYAFSKGAPTFRIVKRGLNICGDCKSEKCIAFNQEVFIPLDNVKRFDLIKERENLRCPSCRNLIIPKTVAFYLCRYKVKGKNFENGSVKDFEFYDSANNRNAVQYYDSMKNGNVFVIELIIEILNYF